MGPHTCGQMCRCDLFTAMVAERRHNVNAYGKPAVNPRHSVAIDITFTPRRKVGLPMNCCFAWGVGYAFPRWNSSPRKALSVAIPLSHAVEISHFLPSTKCCCRAVGSHRARNALLPRIRAQRRKGPVKPHGPALSLALLSASVRSPCYRSVNSRQSQRRNS